MCFLCCSITFKTDFSTNCSQHNGDSLGILCHLLETIHKNGQIYGREIYQNCITIIHMPTYHCLLRNCWPKITLWRHHCYIFTIYTFMWLFPLSKTNQKSHEMTNVCHCGRHKTKIDRWAQDYILKYLANPKYASNVANNFVSYYKQDFQTLTNRKTLYWTILVQNIKTKFHKLFTKTHIYSYFINSILQICKSSSSSFPICKHQQQLH